MLVYIGWWLMGLWDVFWIFWGRFWVIWEWIRYGYWFWGGIGVRWNLMIRDVWLWFGFFLGVWEIFFYFSWELEWWFWIINLDNFVRGWWKYYKVGNIRNNGIIWVSLELLLVVKTVFLEVVFGLIKRN